MIGSNCEQHRIVYVVLYILSQFNFEISENHFDVLTLQCITGHQCSLVRLSLMNSLYHLQASSGTTVHVLHLQYSST